MAFALEFATTDHGLLELAARGHHEPLERLRLNLAAERLSLLEGFEELICLPALRGVERYPHQERTALRVMRKLRGRAILGDEVGLGKTIETGLILKEYVSRGLARRVLILCPPSLLEQWQVEMEGKFGLSFRTSLEAEFRDLGTAAWSSFELIVASHGLARREPHRGALAATPFDVVVVDEAHHLRKRTSATWRLVHDVPRKYLLLLTATPVQNDLEELYNLITLLRPGQLGTPAQFRARFVDPADPRRPRNAAALRELMLDTMVRNTRSSVDLVLPPRRARTLRLRPAAEESRLHARVQEVVREAWGKQARLALTTLLLQAGSCPAALAPTLRKLGHQQLGDEAERLGLGSKAAALTELLAVVKEPVLVFSRFRATLEQLEGHLRGRLPVHSYHGGLSATRREAELERFRQEGGVLLLSEVGGEGKNLQFGRHMVNFDLPWNPMKIEQRVGRIHRIGQTEPIQIVNLCLEGTLEDHLLRLLDEKLNMFELVVGELDMILGPLEDEGDFEDLLVELSVRASTPDELAAEMEQLGEQLTRLLQGHQANQDYENTLFGEEFEVLS